jgi:GAF domain-containing protein
MSRERLLARAICTLADTLIADFDAVDLLTTLSDECVDVLDVAAAGIMLADPDGTLQLITSSSDSMRAVELFELQAQEGPCVDCCRSGLPVISSDLDTMRSCWPRFAPMAITAGFRAADAVPLRLGGRVLGALNLFRSEPGTMSGEDLVAAQALADIATIAIMQHRISVDLRTVNDQLSSALSSRIVIEQAKGILAGRDQVGMDLAFATLRSYARNNNRRLHDVAADVVTGHLSLEAPTLRKPSDKPRPAATQRPGGTRGTS